MKTTFLTTVFYRLSYQTNAKKCTLFQNCFLEQPNAHTDNDLTIKGVNTHE